MADKIHLVTGGTGFIGAALVRRLVKEGHRVRVLDDNSRGADRRLGNVIKNVEMVPGDIRNPEAVKRAAKGVTSLWHLAFVNGTEFFYSKPELVLDVAVKGMVNVLDACQSEKVPELILASSSEVYQTPPKVPTDETAPLSIPDPMNPRYSYAAGKIISEIMTINYGRKGFERVLIFRPHNVYGPDMGWEHVLPQFVLRMKELAAGTEGPIRFPIQGSGRETRAFVFIDDFIDGLMVMHKGGHHLQIYHVGTQQEVAIADVAHLVGDFYGRKVELAPGPEAVGGTPRRCPDIAKLAALGFKPRVDLKTGLPILAAWYDQNAHLAPKKKD
jgi:nucleoside-diphosphate-sugar epimerase